MNMLLLLRCGLLPMLSLLAVGSIAMVLHAPVSAETIPIYDARDLTGRTVINYCESPVSRIMTGGKAGIVCFPTLIMTTGFER